MNYVTYAHAKSNGEIFYIGKGVEKRAISKNNRNNFWHNVVNKHGFNPTILARWQTEQEAFEHEKLLIACFKDLGYKLVNLTDGGEGNSGFKWNQESKTKLSNSRKGIKFSQEQLEKMRKNRVGKKHTVETIQKMKESRKHGSANSKPIEVCGIKFQSMTNFAKFVNKMPIWIKKCVDSNRVEKLEEYYKNAVQAKNSSLCNLA